MPIALDDDPLWYKDAVIYELQVRAFEDSDEDGVGDFKGLTEKLDYIQNLGVTAVWLLPFFPSPLRDDGYDISDFTNVHPSYGTLRDFHTFLKEAHRRGLRVITELVLNHTSDQHPWFRRARKARPGSRWRSFYVWSDTPDKYREARIIFKDFEASNWTWDPVARAYYWHRFYSHQPDLNYDSPDVRQAMLEAVDFWLDMGVDGLRLDAVPYLFEREGTICENLPETHAFLKELRRHIDSSYRNRMLLAEANQWPEDAASYFGSGDESHMAFHFPLMPRLFMSYRQEDRYPITDIFQLTPPIPDTCQWALFLRNHDELTLEMVTDEERDYMYRTYAHDPQMRINLGIRRRLAPLLGNNRRSIELMNALLLSLPGTPVIYNGDEIGMGDNIYLGDRNGVRTPMQWSVDRNAGFSRANPQRLYLPVIIDPEYHFEAVNVESQLANPHSLLWWMKRLIGLRKQSRALSRGAVTFLQPENRRILAFLRRYGDERVLVVVNLSRFVQPANLDLSECRGMTPREMFGHVELPPIEDYPYFLTLAPHSFYWFTLEPARPIEQISSQALDASSLPVLALPDASEVLEPKYRRELSRLLPSYLQRSRWFQRKKRTIRNVEIVDAVPIVLKACSIYFVEVGYSEGNSENYLVPLSLAIAEEADAVLRDHANAVVMRLRAPGVAGVLYNAVWDRNFCDGMVDAVSRRRRFKGEKGEIAGFHTRAPRDIRRLEGVPLQSDVLRADQCNTSIMFSDRLVLKLFRRLEAGINPDLEIGRYLAEKTSFRSTPLTTGGCEYRRGNETMTVAMLQSFVPNQGDAWSHTLDTLSRYFEHALTKSAGNSEGVILKTNPLDLTESDLPPCSGETMRADLEDARTLGERTAEFHLALAKETTEPDFAPEPMTDYYQQSMYHRILGVANQTMRLLRQRLTLLAPGLQEQAQRVLSLEEPMRALLHPMRDRRIKATRIRYHGDYHLRQVLRAGRDFVLIDFEGDPARPLSERRIKRSPLRDVAGMLRSYHYAAHAALFGQVPGIIPHPELKPQLERWGQLWYQCVSSFFLRGYLARAAQSSFVPQSREDFKLLLNAFLLEKAAHELTLELNNRLDWAGIPLKGILQLIDEDRST